MEFSIFTDVARDQLIYQSCENAKCRKKVVPTGNGKLHCPKCNITVKTTIPRLVAVFQVADRSGSAYVTAFEKQAEDLLGKSAIEIARLLASGPAGQVEVDVAINHLVYSRHVMRLRGRQESFNVR